MSGGVLGGLALGSRRLRPRGSRRARLGLRAGSVLVLLAAALAGYLLVAQVRGTKSSTQRLAGESQGDLVQILSDLNTQAGNLRDEIDTLKLQLLSLQSSSQSDAAALVQTEQHLSDLEVLAGTVPVSGPGIVLSVSDPHHQVGYDSLVSVVEELRDAGAEAIAVDGHRVGATSWLGQSGRTLLLDGAPLSEPYTVEAIGDATTLTGGLEIPGGALDSLQSLQQVSAGVARSRQLTLPGLAHAPSFRVAHPVGSGS